MIFGCFLIFLGFLGASISYKRIIPIHFMFAIILTACSVILLTFGITLENIVTEITYQVDIACQDGASSIGGISQSLNELYTSADSFYCVASNGCTWYSTTMVGAGYTSANSSTAIINVQGCTEYLEDAYADYGVKFDNVAALQEYLDYFGEIESQSNCSGICVLQTKYYFSDINAGVPETKCFGSISETITSAEVKNYEICYIISGVVWFMVWFVQFGLCCRKNQNAKQGQTKNF
jgi:hypothetical protein